MKNSNKTESMLEHKERVKAFFEGLHGGVPYDLIRRIKHKLKGHSNNGVVVNGDMNSTSLLLHAIATIRSQFLLDKVTEESICEVLAMIRRDWWIDNDQFIFASVVIAFDPDRKLTMVIHSLRHKSTVGCITVIPEDDPLATFIGDAKLTSFDSKLTQSECDERADMARNEYLNQEHNKTALK